MNPRISLGLFFRGKPRGIKPFHPPVPRYEFRIKLMNMLLLYNTLSKQKGQFKPLVDNTVGLYTCGPTVYNYAHIGNLRSYVFEDILRRTLKYNGYDVTHVMNITDVGHLTDDADQGEDKMEKGSKREGKSAWEIAEF